MFFSILLPLQKFKFASPRLLMNTTLSQSLALGLLADNSLDGTCLVQSTQCQLLPQKIWNTDSSEPVSTVPDASRLTRQVSSAAGG